MRRKKSAIRRWMTIAVLIGSLFLPPSTLPVNQAHYDSSSAPSLSWETVETLSRMKPGPETKEAFTAQRVRIAGFIYQWHVKPGAREFLLVPKSSCFEDPRTWRASSVILVRMPPQTSRPVGCHPILVEGTLRWDSANAPNRRPLLESAEVAPDWERMPLGREPSPADPTLSRTL